MSAAKMRQMIPAPPLKTAMEIPIPKTQRTKLLILMNPKETPLPDINTIRL